MHEVPSYENHRVHGVSNLNAFRDGSRVLKTIVTELKRPAGRQMATDVALVGHGWDGVERRNGPDRRTREEHRAPGGPDTDRRQHRGRRASDRSVLLHVVPRHDWSENAW